MVVSINDGIYIKNPAYKTLHKNKHNIWNAKPKNKTNRGINAHASQVSIIPAILSNQFCEKKLSITIAINNK